MYPDLRSLRARWIAAISLSAAPACTTTTSSSSDAAATDVLIDAAPSQDRVSVVDAAPTADAPQPLDAGAPDAAVPPPACRSGTATRECFTRAQLETMLRFPGGGPASDAGLQIDASYAPNGCMQAEFARDSCCVPASAGPWVEHDTCCYWFCTGSCCGRALRVEGAPRVAPRARSEGWRVVLPEVAVTPDEARALADAWRGDAQMEHASIAAFARVTLALIAHGAPASLVEDTQRAALEEVDHARRCYSLAARYSGEAEAPGPVALGDAAGAMSLAALAVDTLREGCVGESLAAASAMAQRDGASDPAVREGLARIAGDEARHAELAWRTLAWCLRVGDDAVREAVHGAWRAMQGGAMSGPFAERPAAVSEDRWRAHGRLGAREAAACAARAWRELVRPCYDALWVSRAS